MVELERWGYTPVGVFGTLRIGRWSCYTVERPWAGNRPNVSCIPEGVYPLRMRRSGVVTRSTGGEYQEGWEVCDVPGRSYIMLHPANTMDDLEGCIGPGEDIGVVGGKWSVTHSRAAFRELMDQLDERDEWTLDIRPVRVQWP